MRRYVAFLRAINVAGHAKVRMSDVRDAFSAAGGANVTTYIQTGNVVFDALSLRAAAVVRGARLELGRTMGEEPQVILRPMRRLADLVPNSAYEDNRSPSSRGHGCLDRNGVGSRRTYGPLGERGTRSGHPSPR